MYKLLIYRYVEPTMAGPSGILAPDSQCYCFSFKTHEAAKAAEAHFARGDLCTQIVIDN